MLGALATNARCRSRPVHRDYAVGLKDCQDFVRVLQVQDEAPPCIISSHMRRVDPDSHWFATVVENDANYCVGFKHDVLDGTEIVPSGIDNGHPH